MRGLASAGYAWQAELLPSGCEDSARGGPEAAEAIVDVTVERGTLPGTTQRPGASANEMVIVTGRAVGETMLRLTHARPWERSARPAAQHDVRLVVTD